MARRLVLGIGLGMLLASPAFAQELDELEPIEEAVEDADPLSTSLRQLQLDFRAPSGFERVYKVPGRDDLLMRIDGGLYAVFSTSRYVATKSGVLPIIPNDTIFFIGPPQARDLDVLAPAAPIPITAYSELPMKDLVTIPREEHPPLDLRRQSVVTNRLELRLDESEPTAVPPPLPVKERHPAYAVPIASERTAAAPPGPAILTDAAYRSSRLHALMRRAARAAAYAARGPHPSSSK